MRSKVALLVVVACAVVTSAAAGAAPTSTAQLAAVLTSKQEIPAPKNVASNASGKFTAVVSGGQMAWRLSLSHLNKGPTSAFIHAGRPDIPHGAVLITLCNPCSSQARGTALVQGELLKSMKLGYTYVNVHTSTNPRGEIRGQIKLAK
jgi:hypothetical protein